MTDSGRLLTFREGTVSAKGCRSVGHQKQLKSWRSRRGPARCLALRRTPLSLRKFARWRTDSPSYLATTRSSCLKRFRDRQQSTMLGGETFLRYAVLAQLMVALAYSDISPLSSISTALQFAPPSLFP
jgi:hypothetical protein